MAWQVHSSFVYIRIFVFFCCAKLVPSLPEKCSYNLYAYKAVITSPNFPLAYPSGRRCSWNIWTLPVHKVKAVFQHFDLEESTLCTYDNVTATDYKMHTKSTIDVFCGHRMPYPLISSENRMVITFITDPRIQRTGFKINITSVLCGGNLVNDTGVIQSPSYPYDYTGDKECIWTIRVDEGFQILLNINISMRDTHQQEDCKHEFIKIKNGLGPQSDTLFHVCDSSPVKDIQSSSNEVMLQYTSSQAAQNMNFTIAYQKTICGTTFNQSEGLIFSPNLKTIKQKGECIWKIIVPDDYQIYLLLKNLHIPSSLNCTLASLTVYDGDDMNSSILQSMCGNITPLELYSTGNSIIIQYNYSPMATNAAFELNFTKVTYGILLEDEGQIKIPDMSTFTLPFDGRWTLVVPEGKHVMLQINEIEMFENCSDSQLILYDGPYSERQTVQQRYCSNDVPREVHSISNRLTIRFQAKLILPYSTFQANFTSSDEICGGILEGNGKIESPKLLYRPHEDVTCTWILKVDDGHPVALLINYLKLMSADDCLEVYDGTDAFESPEQRVCGNFMIENFKPLYSLSTEMTVVLRISSSKNTSGETIENTRLSANFSEGFYTKHEFQNGGLIRAFGQPGNLSYSNYQSYTTKSLTIRSIQGRRLRLKIDALNWLDCDGCECNSIILQENNNNIYNGHSTIKTICNKKDLKHTKFITTRSSQVVIQFEMQAVAQRSFVILFHEVPKPFMEWSI